MKERANPPSRRGLLLLVLLLAAVSLALSGCVVVWSIQVVRLCERTAEELPVMLDARGPAGFSSAERGSPFSCHVLGLSGERRLDRDLVVHKAEKAQPLSIRFKPLLGWGKLVFRSGGHCAVATGKAGHEQVVLPPGVYEVYWVGAHFWGSAEIMAAQDRAIRWVP